MALTVATVMVVLIISGLPTARRNRCLFNLNQIYSAILSVSLENRLYVGDPVPRGRVAEVLAWGLPTCPSGGHYVVAVVVGDTPMCSYHGDLLKLPAPAYEVSTNVPTKWFQFREVQSPEFSADDFADLTALARKLKQPAHAIDHYLRSQSSPATVEALANYQGVSSDPAPLRTTLLQDLNKLIRGPLIYDARRFAGVVLRKETELRLYYVPQGDALVSLNRLLLEDAYPVELSRAPRSP